jgi:hypothetical protein
MEKNTITSENAEIRERFLIELPDGKRKTWSHKDSRHIQELREANFSIRKIGSIMHCSTWHVQQAIKGKI